MAKPNKDRQPIGPLILKNYSFLKSICKSRSEEKRNKLLKEATREELLSLVEVCHNILTSNFQLTERQKRKLFPFADTVRRLSRARSEKRARQVIREHQTGGGGPAIFASLLAPILVEAAQHLISNFVRKGSKNEH